MLKILRSLKKRCCTFHEIHENIFSFLLFTLLVFIRDVGTNAAEIFTSNEEISSFNLLLSVVDCMVRYTSNIRACTQKQNTGVIFPRRI